MKNFRIRAVLEFLAYLRLFQNFSFWNSRLEFKGKTGLGLIWGLTGFSKSLSKTNRALEQAHLSHNHNTEIGI
jgi:hypothetical protein